MTFAAVLFDWRGTLVTSPGPSWALERALTQLGRPAQTGDVAAVLDAVMTANGDGNRLDTPGMDTDAALHHEISMAVFGDAGRHARTTIGVPSLPADALVEVEGLFEID